MAEKSVVLTIENVEKAIAAFESIDPNDEFAYEKAVLTYLTIKFLPIFIVDIPADTPLFRSRTHERDTLFEQISEISLAPNKVVSNFARCNRPFQSKFYCSENRPTSYMELVESWVDTKKVGDKVCVTISEWLLKSSLPFIIVTSPDKEKRASKFDQIHGKIIDTFIDRHTGETREANIIFYRYLFEKFRKSAKKDLKTYIITSAYCNVSLHLAGDKASGVYYPSIPFKEQGVNFCINSKFVTKEHLELVSVARNEFMVEENEIGKFNFQETEFRQSKGLDLIGGTIKW
ncbi:MAG TPA: hypothetical protein PKL56_15945 [Cyclobacteriaceae bacterium]|nr:hypothetical protein [Cyclobacteriaceae bacterium]HMX88029.1 hypothetical protein [Saprospiraceae bacterium]HMX00861.1 hypothetical protein [Cyclobacteriaceae bacterium]HMY93665.1 hypothetical protein [Cyclobacteriaceae bacterium]HNA12901.1 hypothetical protein [Cyclobacteriaceae bacterium]